MKPPKNFETQRLRLQPPTLEDATAIYHAYARDPEVTRYLVWRPHSSVQDTEAFLRQCMKAWSTNSAFPWIIFHKKKSQLIGMVELRIEGFKADIGYVLAHSYWGQGYMSEAAHHVVQWALKQDAIYRVWALCDAENKASKRVLEKLGMKLEGILCREIIRPNMSDEPRDSCCYAITK